MKTISLPHFATRVEYGKRRCGRPSQNLLHTTKKRVYEHTLGHFNYDEFMYEDNMMYAAAQRRDFLIGSAAAPTPCTIFDWTVVAG